ncbi:MAG: alpha/beta fold hydrolase [Actinomycetales bacterium]
MNTTANGTVPLSPPTTASPASAGHIGRIVATSLVGGAVLALVLALLVFGGATEPVVGGAVLIGFAAGWAALAWTSQRRTDQPQPWAWVPAGVFGTVGLAQIALRPGAGVMNASAWVWPVLLLAVAGWIVTRSRRTLLSWSRRLVVYPIAGVMVMSAAGAGYESVREAMDSSAHHMTGQLVSVGDHRLHISCAGTGSPTVVLEPGLGEPAVMMAGWIQPAVALTTRVCSYDRAGRGDSDPASGPQDGPAMARDLHALLANAHVPGPYVLVGHSSGAVYMKVYAHQYPEQVAGMVLLDPQPSNAYAALPGWSTFHFLFRRYSAIVPSIARLGGMRLIYQSQAADLPSAARSEERADWSTARHNRSVRDEFAELRTVLAQSQALTSIGDKPLIVLTALKDMQNGWLPLQDKMLTLSTNSQHRFAPNGTHASLTEDRGQAAISATAIVDVVNAVRDSDGPR